MQPKRLKIMTIGNSGVGKTSIILKYGKNIFSSGTIATNGVEFISASVEINKKNVIVEFWDTAGQEVYKSLVRSYYKDKDGLFLVYDIFDRDSFENLKFWTNEIKKNADKDIEYIIVGNKLDLLEEGKEREVEYEEAKFFARDLNVDYFETSAKTGVGLEETFQKFFKRILKMKEEGYDPKRTESIFTEGKQEKVDYFNEITSKRELEPIRPNTDSIVIDTKKHRESKGRLSKSPNNPKEKSCCN